MVESQAGSGESIYLETDWMRRHRVVSAAGLWVMLGLTGCLRSTKLVRQTVTPDVYRTASVETIKQDVSARDASIKTLTASVLVTAQEGGGRTGKVTTYTSLRGYIYARQPRDLRVILQVPVLGSRALDMVSNGERFTLVHATASKGDVWMQGTNTVTTPSKNGLENLRPPVFFDALLVPGVTDGQSVSMTESTRILPSPEKKRTDLEEPDYDVTVTEPKSPGVLRVVRVLHINRVNMLPYQQDLYDEAGQVVQTTTYDKYQTVNGVPFPMVINITRPQEQYGLKVQVTKVALNEPLADDQFELKIPAGVPVQKLP